MSVESWLLHSVQIIWFDTVNKLDVDCWNMGCFRGKVRSSNEVSCRKSCTFVAFPTGPIKPLVNHWHTDCWLKLWKRSLSRLLLSHWHLPTAEKKAGCAVSDHVSHISSRDIWCNILTSTSPPIGTAGQPAAEDVQPGGEERGRRRKREGGEPCLFLSYI